ncbi:MAG: metal/formaldehyde-sensitive transcriptional repressor [Lentisphaeraceae bacterium]|nr:metal/formaldehyde-sensitive transcriptional repressor [Lentisphaeraceae bacterium]
MAHIHEDNKKIKARIKRIKGQLEAVERGLDGEGDCFKVLQTLAACRGAMNGLLGEIVESHIKEHIMTDANNPKSAQDKEALDLIQLLKTYWK